MTGLRLETLTVDLRLFGVQGWTTEEQGIADRGAAGKNQMAFMARALLGLTETPDADAADALAIGLTHPRSQEAASRGIPGATQI